MPLLPPIMSAIFPSSLPMYCARPGAQPSLDTFSNLVAIAIIVTAAATLHAHGITNIQTSSQAAEALRPVAGRFAFSVFTLGILGTGLLAVPMLAGCGRSD